jgi:hypothetical protein
MFLCCPSMLTSLLAPQTPFDTWNIEWGKEKRLRDMKIDEINKLPAQLRAAAALKEEGRKAEWEQANPAPPIDSTVETIPLPEPIGKASQLPSKFSFIRRIFS